MKQTISIEHKRLQSPLIKFSPLTKPLFKTALFYLFYSPSISQDQFLSKDTDKDLSINASFYSGKSLLEAAFIISLLILGLNQSQTIIHYPISKKANKQLKRQLRDSLIAGMVICNVSPSIYYALSLRKKHKLINKEHHSNIKSITNFLIYFFSINLLEAVLP